MTLGVSLAQRQAGADNGDAIGAIFLLEGIVDVPYLLSQVSLGENHYLLARSATIFSPS